MHSELCNPVIHVSYFKCVRACFAICRVVEMDQIMLMVKLLGIPSPSMLKNVDDAVSAELRTCA